MNLVVERGTVEVMVGSSSQDTPLQADFQINGSRRLQDQDRVFFSSANIV